MHHVGINTDLLLSKFPYIVLIITFKIFIISMISNETTNGLTMHM